ncbi:MAG: acyl-CoA dehydrogenase family protein [Bacteroidota bacterium]
MSNLLKGGQFLVKESSFNDVYIPEEFTEEQLMFRDSVRDFVANEISPILDRLDKMEEGLAVAKLEMAGEMGLLGTAIPEAYGGSAMDFNTNSILVEQMGVAHGFSVTLGAHIGIGTLPILYFGTEAQKQKYLPKLATGELKASYCLTEPGSGSDALSAKSKAMLSEDGSHYILNGQKMWITNAGFADVFIVFAQENGTNFTGFIVEKTMEGVKLGAEEQKLGIKCSSTRQVFFENVKVPKENVLGEVGKGHKIAFNILNIGRYKLAAGVTGGAKKACDVAIKYANERVQFKQSISNFGAIKFKIAEMAIRLWTTESAVYRTSDMIDKKEKELHAAGKAANESLLGAAEEYAIECAMLKVIASETLDYVVDEALQIYGGMGYSEEAPAARAYRDARINRIFEGTNEINRLLTLDMLIKRAMKGQIDLLTPAMAIQKELMSIPDFGMPDTEDIFYNEKKAIVNAKKGLLMVAGAAVQKLMMQLEQEQEILMNAADVMNDIYVMESALLRTQKLIDKKGIENCQLYIDITKVFISDAMERININGKHAIVAFAEGDELRMMLMGLKRFTKHEAINTNKLRRNIAAKLIEANGYIL